MTSLVMAISLSTLLSVIAIALHIHLIEHRGGFLLSMMRAERHAHHDGSC